MTNVKSLIIGVTGNIGTGKSTVSKRLSEKGAVLIEGDSLGREVLERFPEMLIWLRSRYGDSVFKGNQLDRKALGNIVFKDCKAREDLDKHIWPYIARLLEEQITSSSNGNIIVVDAALIFEWEDQQRYDIVITVTCPRENAILQAASRMNMSPEEIAARFDSQIDQEIKAQKADYIIRNESTIEDLLESVDELWKIITGPSPAA